MFPWNLFPFNKKFNNPMGQFDQNDIEKYVKDMMNQMMPTQMQDMFGSQDWMKDWMRPKTKPEDPPSEQKNEGNLSYSVFETHHHVYIRIHIKEDTWLSKMKLYHTSNQLIIEHIPSEEDKQTIVLPAIVRKKGTSANYKEGILEIKLQKNIDMQFSEIEVTEN
ncbi:Hsp20/alpha crystallin family protein [Neobacillus sp. D3-1R]|uniref:Hsp20/alpha crystallin family protein n=1 Tax=Neobacillus sp. D3-1R TaxID=3445778 RepID=UPI003FA142E1